mmetsp:Transcript_32723/g.100780  ORF Transcript_32723/g.100780 Transcript_32723/m.100780 type:complete len:188 (-) Transcript_32723:72-635(-)
MSRASSLLVALVAATAAAETLVNQQPNPHTDTEGACAAASFADLLEVPHLAPLATQTDTFVGEAAARTPGGARVRLYNFKQPRRLSAAELPFSVAPVAFPRDDPRLLVASAAHADSWFPGYAWEVVGARTPCGFAHLGWRFANAEGAFLALIVRPSDDEAAAWAVGNPATAALAALFLTTSARGASL